MNCSCSVSVWLCHFDKAIDLFPDLLKHAGHIEKLDADKHKLALPRPDVLITWYYILSRSKSY